MVIALDQTPISIPPRNAIGQNIMDGLNVERFLDFGVGSKVKVEQNDTWYQSRN